jgi:hypothetical protein
LGATEAQGETLAGTGTTNGNITNDPATWPTGDRIWDCVRAVAIQEGYPNGPGAAPFNLNNPGDLGPGDEHGQATAGKAEFHGGSSIIHFATALGGFTACYTKISNMLAGKSSVYGSNWTLRQIGAKWAADPNWAAGVARTLGIDPNVSGFADYVNGACGGSCACCCCQNG